MITIKVTSCHSLFVSKSVSKVNNNTKTAPSFSALVILICETSTTQLTRNKRQNPWELDFQNNPNNGFGQRPPRPFRQRPTNRPPIRNTTPEGMLLNRPLTPDPAASTTVSPRIQNCLKTCPVTSEYNPVCGSNGQIYNNRNYLRCAQFCGSELFITSFMV